ncbi:hypothetical protein Leryth_003607 [Lithospermum erythrorhizon]|uniref:Uncharacterized protein n=1 Tax=Lithospermum erythrorhizon TaxID=34254 RepID=A0AAV3QM71_LITER|nr:hypothetical protein Leryth_003607 [Lithospermum erythrorhizon]
MKVLNRFRKIVMRFILIVPSGRGNWSHNHHQTTPRHHVARRRSCDSSKEAQDTPKVSCSYNYSSNSHYNEAIADCIEFFNKSSQEGIFFNSRKSNVTV